MHRLNALEQGLLPYHDHPLQPADYATIGGVIHKLGTVSYIRNSHGLVIGDTEHGYAAVSWMHDGAIHTSTNYGANTYSLEVFRWLEPNDSHELPALIDFYAYGTTQFATFGLARLVHKGTKTDTDAQVLLADAKRMGVVTQTGKLARKAPTKAVQLNFKRSILSIAQRRSFI